ncbi:MAG: radical SAM protein [Acidobacteria bacterium]|nr:radical SAM protein [Acidobacteriota bacterium]
MANAWRRHERQWKDHRYVYAVISRRSRGVSIGVNLNPGKGCNFDCIYCQVNRRLPAVVRRVDLKRLAGELDTILQAEQKDSLYEDTPFDVLKPDERGVRDIAFSGDGEPTAFRRFEEAVRIAADARFRFGLDTTKLVVLTNAAYLDRPLVRAGLVLLDQNNGEIWAKLDAGTEEYFRQVNRSRTPFERILCNILDAARTRPLVIQSLWPKIHGAAPPDSEISAYCSRLNDIISAGGRLRKIQLHTIARDPAESFVSRLPDKALDRIASIVRSRVAVPVEVYY